MTTREAQQFIESHGLKDAIEWLEIEVSKVLDSYYEIDENINPYEEGESLILEVYCNIDSPIFRDLRHQICNTMLEKYPNLYSVISIVKWSAEDLPLLKLTEQMIEDLPLQMASTKECRDAGGVPKNNYSAKSNLPHGVFRIVNSSWSQFYLIWFKGSECIVEIYHKVEVHKRITGYRKLASLVVQLTDPQLINKVNEFLKHHITKEYDTR